MSIASRINEIGVHLTKDWRSIEALTGEVSVDKNIENIAAVVDSIYEKYPKATGTGENVSLTTNAGKMKVNLLGNTSQYTTTGKNLLRPDSNLATSTMSGITFTPVYDNGELVRIDIKGTSNARAYYYLQSTMIEYGNIEGNLTLSTTGTGSGIYIQHDNYINGTYQTGNIASGTVNATFNPNSLGYTQYRDYINIPYSSSTTYNTSVYPMLEKGNTATTYEPYTGGIASPNPSYPQDVHIVSGDNTINVTGKNLVSSYSRIGNQMYLNGTTSTTNYIFKPGTYTISYKKNTSSYAYIFMRKPSSSSNESVGSANPITFTSDENFNVWVYISDMQDNDVSDIQLELSSTATSYEPYQSTSYPIHLGEHWLGWIGDYKDRFFKNIPNTTDYKSDLEDNEWYLEKKIGKVVLDGSENFTYELVEGLDAFQYTIPEMLETNVGDGLSNYYKNTDGISKIEDGVIRFGWGNKNIYFFNETSRFGSSIANFKTWLESHNLTAYYILATPTYTQITGTLKDELEAVWRANSYKGQTNINQVNNDLPFIVDATALMGGGE